MNSMLTEIIKFIGGSHSMEEFKGLIYYFISFALIILVALPVHEMAHGFMAHKLGDDTAKWNGRLTMNPIAHMDPIGTLMIFLIGFGYAKPVPVNPNNFKNYKTGMLLTALAGPVSNLLMAVASIGILKLVYVMNVTASVWNIVSQIIVYFALLNIGLGVFNLLPIPPLDGFRIIANVLPAKWTYFVDRYQLFITFGVMLLIFSGYLNGPINYLVSGIAGFLFHVFGLA